MQKTWFEELVGFKESKEAINKNLFLKKDMLISLINGKEYDCGVFEILSLKELREKVKLFKNKTSKFSIRQEIADVGALHQDMDNEGALFQVASQFNLLEMSSPLVTPEDGVSRYIHDHTQGPRCAICAGAGTIYRNYFVAVNGSRGQSKSNQIDCLDKLGEALGNQDKKLWEMKNGYAWLSEDGLMETYQLLKEESDENLDVLRELLKVGIHWGTEVTLEGKKQKVSQIYCSALPISYVGYDVFLWKPFATLILEATYEATICAGILNAKRTGNKKIYLTFIGGGAFGNDMSWILNAIKRVLDMYVKYDLEIVIVSYASENEEVNTMIAMYS